MKPQRKQKPETALVKSCLQYLHMKGVMAWRNNSGGIQKGNHFIRFGQVGSADILGILPGGQFLAVECKVGKNPLSEAQQDWLQRASEAGAKALVVRALEELMEQV
jgi:hypothetical protein